MNDSIEKPRHNLNESASGVIEPATINKINAETLPSQSKEFKSKTANKSSIHEHYCGTIEKGFEFNRPSTEQFLIAIKVKYELMEMYKDSFEKCSSFLVCPILIKNKLHIYVGCTEKDMMKRELPHSYKDIPIHVDFNLVENCGSINSKKNANQGTLLNDMLPQAFKKKLEMGDNIGPILQRRAGTLGGFVKARANEIDTESKTFGITCGHVIGDYDINNKTKLNGFQQPSQLLYPRTLKIASGGLCNELGAGCATLFNKFTIINDQRLDYMLLDCEREIREPLNSSDKEIDGFKIQIQPMFINIKEKADDFVPPNMILDAEGKFVRFDDTETEKKKLAKLGAVSGLTYDGCMLSSIREACSIRIKGEKITTNEFACGDEPDSPKVGDIPLPVFQNDWSVGGDSGSFIFSQTSQSIVGLLIARSVDQPKMNFFTPIEDIMKDCKLSYQLEISLVKEVD
jgi:hypothetical protein